MELSYFKSLRNKSGERNILEILDDIKEGNVQLDLILQIREMANAKKEYGDLKKVLESFAPSGVFYDSHKVADLKEYSRLMVLDIDELGPRKLPKTKETAKKCPYSRVVFVSPSGKGLKILVEVDADVELHGVSFVQVAEHYEGLLGTQVDRSGSDVSRLCFMSYDPELYYNESSNVFKIVDAFLGEYKSAVEVTKTKYVFQNGQRNNFVHYLANNCNRIGIPEKVALRLILKEYGYDEKEVSVTIKSAYSNLHEHKKNPPVESKWGGIEDFLRENYYFRYNEFTGMTEYCTKAEDKYSALTDYLGNSIIRRLQKSGKRVSKERLYTILNSDFSPKYHPVKEYIDGLLEWDGKTDYIEELAKRVSTDDDVFFRDAFKRWFVAMVASALEEDSTNQTAIIFSGKQGIGKSTFFRRLLPDCLQQYSYSGMIDPRNKDTLVHLAECLLIDMDELSSLTRKGNNEVKELITKDKIRIRRAYGRNNEFLPRRASFVGSVNEKEFLTDATGNRRFLCFNVEKIDYMSEVNHAGLFAQAKNLIENGFKHYFDGEEIQKLNMRNELFRQKSFVEELIETNFKPAKNLNAAMIYASAGDLQLRLKQDYGVGADSTSTIQIGKALSNLGFERLKRKGRYVYAIDTVDDLDDDEFTIIPDEELDFVDVFEDLDPAC